MCNFIELHPDNLDSEHICCAFSDKKCTQGYQMKKDWLRSEFKKGYVFRRLDARAKVFLEYGPAESAWVPVDAPGYLMMNCFWVSGQYKGKGHAKALLQSALDDAARQDKHGLVTVVGTQKFLFMSDTKWLLRQDFQEVERTTDGFSLLVRKLHDDAPDPSFLPVVKQPPVPVRSGLTVYYSNRCPFTEYYVREELPKAAANRQLGLHIEHLNTMEQARSAPSPATIFSLFLDGRFITTDVSVCLDNRFDHIVNKALRNT